MQRHKSSNLDALKLILSKASPSLTKNFIVIMKVINHGIYLNEPQVQQKRRYLNFY